jgi:hypothetical protein
MVDQRRNPHINPFYRCALSPTSIVMHFGYPHHHSTVLSLVIFVHFVNHSDPYTHSSTLLSIPVTEVWPTAIVVLVVTELICIAIIHYSLSHERLVIQ